MFGLMIFMFGMLTNEMLNRRSERLEYEKRRKEEKFNKLEMDVQMIRSYLEQVNEKLHLPKMAL